MIGKTIGEITPGDRAEITRVVAQDDIVAFVEAVGDYNPVHSDAAYAAGTPFKAPIAPGVSRLRRRRHPAAGPGRHLSVAVVEVRQAGQGG